MDTERGDVGRAPSYSTSDEGAGTPLEITAYKDVLEILRSQRFVTENGAGDGEFRQGAMLRLHGTEHARRRRTINHLIRDHERLRNSYLYPALTANLEEVLRHRDGNGVAHADLVALISRTSVQVACAMMGLS